MTVQSFYHTCAIGTLLGIASALFSLTLNEWMKNGMILEFWGNFLNRLYDKGYSWIAKPLGYCIYCFSKWVLIGLFIVFTDHSLLTLIVSSGISFYFIKKNEKML